MIRKRAKSVLFAKLYILFASSGKGKLATLFVGRDQESAREAANREEFGIFGKEIWALSTLTEKRSQFTKTADGSR